MCMIGMLCTLHLCQQYLWMTVVKKICVMSSEIYKLHSLAIVISKETVRHVYRSYITKILLDNSKPCIIKKNSTPFEPL